MKEATGKFLDKADRVIQAAERMLASGDAEFAVGRVYYAMFYLAEALLNEKGFRFRKHGGASGSDPLQPFPRRVLPPRSLWLRYPTAPPRGLPFPATPRERLSGSSPRRITTGF